MNPLVPEFILHKESQHETSGAFDAAALFVDIAGFTAVTTRLVQHGREGAEALAHTLRFYFDPLILAVHEAGGFITGFAGDACTALFDDAPDLPALVRLLHELAQRYGGTFSGLDFGDKGTNVLVHFGAPVAHENDTERALDFANELRRVCPAPIRLRAGITRDVRYVGFNGGTRRHEFACLGRATNLAARLMIKAASGEILCDPRVAADASAAYHLESRGELTLKGFDEPIEAFSLGRKRQQSNQKEFSAKELVGRSTELAALEAAVAPIFAIPPRPAGVIYLDGDAGLGKSHFVETFRRALDALALYEQAVDLCRDG